LESDGRGEGLVDRAAPLAAAVMSGGAVPNNSTNVPVTLISEQREKRITVSNQMRGGGSICSFSVKMKLAVTV
jgi:hypothetical protein